jgi:hypothetical protein
MIQSANRVLDISCELACQRTLDAKWTSGLPIHRKRVPLNSECFALLLNSANGAETCSDFVNGCFCDFVIGGKLEAADIHRTLCVLF